MPRAIVMIPLPAPCKHGIGRAQAAHHRRPVRSRRSDSSASRPSPRTTDESGRATRLRAGGLPTCAGPTSVPASKACAGVAPNATSMVGRMAETRTDEARRREHVGQQDHGEGLALAPDRLALSWFLIRISAASASRAAATRLRGRATTTWIAAQTCTRRASRSLLPARS